MSQTPEPATIAHKLHDILAIAIRAGISGLQHWTQIEDVANAAANLSPIHRISRLWLKNEKTSKLGIKSKRAKTGSKKKSP